jgi:restriction system protein
MPVPKYDELFEPLLKAMHQLGGSASLPEREETGAEILRLTEKEIAEINRVPGPNFPTGLPGRAIT